jgi:tol-pal system protein YbgF
MKHVFRYGRWIILVGILLLAACASNLQQQVDSQGHAISRLQQRIQEIDRMQRRYQADTHSELDQIRREIQLIQGGIEENSHRTQKDISDLKSRIDYMLASLREKQGQIEQMQKQVASSRARSQRTQTPSSAAPSNEQVMYNQAYNHFNRSQFKKSRVLFEKFINTYPTSDLADNAMYWIGTSYYKEKKYEEAIAAFDDVIKSYPQGNKVPDSHYLQALSFLQLGDPLTAQILLETLIQNFPTAEAASLGKIKYKEIKAKETP